MSCFPFLPPLCEVATSFVIHSSGSQSGYARETVTENLRGLFLAKFWEQKSCSGPFYSCQSSIQESVHLAAKAQVRLWRAEMEEGEEGGHPWFRGRGQGDTNIS